MPGPAQSAVTFADACRALDESLTSARLQDPDVVTSLVYQRHAPRKPGEAAFQLAEGTVDDGAQPEYEYARRVAGEAWGVLEVLRSSMGDWNTDLGQEHEGAVPLGHKLKTEKELAASLSRKLSQPRRPLRRGHDGALPHSPESITMPGPRTPARQLPWNLQEQGKMHRVLYRPGPEGAPFHTMLLEGIVHSSVGTALSVCWEAPYYPQWWPQFSVPTFKASESYVAAAVSRYHSLSITRLKVPWPFATRELGVASRVSFIDPETGIILVTLATLPEDPAQCSESLTGYGPDKVPKVPAGVVRLGVDGGYLIQRLGPSCCYMRAFVNVDVKLDVVPVWVINFINRTLAGAGFQVLSQVVSDAVTGRKGVGATFQGLLAQENTLYKEVDSLLSKDPGAAEDTADLQAASQLPLPSKEANGEVPDVAGREERGTAAGGNVDGEGEAADMASRAQGDLKEQLGPHVPAGSTELEQHDFVPAFATLPSMKARDPEMSDALSFLDEVIVQVKSDTMSMYSEMAPASRGLHGAKAMEDDQASIPAMPGKGKKGKRRWWKKLMFGKMCTVDE